MPFDGNWQADGGLGDLNTPNISLARLQPRFYLPTSPMQGATTEWRGPDGLQIVAGGGVPGLFEGIEVPNFRTLDGSTATAGAQWSPASHWTVGGQLIEAHDVNPSLGPVVDGAALITSRTELLTAAWADQGERLQFNLLDGDVSGKANAVGGWVDGSITEGRIQQNAGVFRIDPNMTWGNQVISDDMQGGYYRFGYLSRQWLADVGIDEVRSVSGAGASTTFVTGDARYQISRDWGIGSLANIARSDGGTNWTLGGYLDHVNAWGTGRAQADLAEVESGRDIYARAESELVDAGRHAAQHFDVDRAHQRRHRQWRSGRQHPPRHRRVRRRSIHHPLECRGQRELGDRRAGPRGTGRVRQCLVDLPHVAELGDSRDLL